VQFQSTITGTSSQAWTFENGIPSQSSEKNPLVQFNTGGVHKVSLKITNGFRTIQKDTVINLEPTLSAIFTPTKISSLYELEVPITFTLKNQSQGALTYKWTMPGASPASSTAKEPTINYSLPGTYKISLETSNGKTTQTSDTEIELAADKGFRIYSNIKFGIQAAQDSLGSYFSTSLGRIIRSNEVLTDAESAAIDLAFFGIDQKFTFMQFVSPQNVVEKGFNAIKLATNTKFLNNQVLLSVENFTKIDKDILANLPISKTLEINKSIQLPLPTVILFQNAAGKKGAILVKDKVSNGQNSYIVADIKVLK
jgi:PKD domain